MPAGYRFLPMVYDRWQETYGKDYSTIILPRLLSTIRRYKIATTTMLDLACGTGSLTLMMARRGWTVWGVDGSEGMISESRKKFVGRELPVTFLQEDMTQLYLPDRVGLVTCFFDSLNHLTSKLDLKATVRRVHSVLVPSGYFIFDVNNELCFRRLWTRTDMIEHRDFTLVLKNRYNAGRRLAHSEASIFFNVGNRFEEYTEVVKERCYTDKELLDVLKHSGFRVLERTDFNFTREPSLGKIKTWWVAQRR
jgi:SAM-dependent methyltransferase